MSDLRDLQKKALVIRKKYNAVNKEDGDAEWNGIDYAAGLVGDVGGLMKLIMAKEGKRYGENIDRKMMHEIGDCLWSLFVIADCYDIDLEEAFNSTVDELNKRQE